jgi:hypothetical protein
MPKIGAGVLLLVAAGAGQMRFQQVPHGPAADGFKFLYTLPCDARIPGNGRGLRNGVSGVPPTRRNGRGMSDRDYTVMYALLPTGGEPATQKPEFSENIVSYT